MIYTAVIGGKDNVRKDIKCFTKGYKFQNPRMNARMYKALSHLFIEDEWIIWIDGNINLFVSEEELIAMTKPYSVGVFRHPERNCVYKEGQFIKKLAREGKKVVNEKLIDRQLEDYNEMSYPKDNGLGATFILIRQNTPHINRLNEMWWAHICRYSLRDQLSFPFVFDEQITYLPKVPMGKNQYFERIKHIKSN